MTKSNYDMKNNKESNTDISALNNEDRANLDSANLTVNDTMENANNAFMTDMGICNNIAHGINAHVMAGNQNIALGINANVATGEGNIALGHNAHVINTAGNENTAIGRGAHVTAGIQNITFGSNARVTGGAGAANTVIGNGANVTSGCWNTVVGNSTSVTAGERNSVFGHGAHVTAGSRNIALGDNAHVAKTAGIANVAIGHGAHVVAGTRNTAIGHNARVIDNAGCYNTVLGTHSNVTRGINNTALGVRAQVTGGNWNTTLGNHARVTVGNSNIALGSGARVLDTAGDNNTALGNHAHVLNGSHNIALSQNAQVLSGSGSIALGDNARVAAVNSQGSIAIGRIANVTHAAAVVLTPNNGPTTRSSTANNQILLGYSGITPTAFAALSNISDQRDKTDVSELKYDPLNFINALQPKQYRTDFRSDYVRYEEITDAEYEKLDKYTQLHEVSDVQVFGIEGTDIEWIEDEIFINQEEAIALQSRILNDSDRYTTKFISNFAKSKEAALEEFKKLNPQQVKAFSISIDDAEINTEELDLDINVETLIKETLIKETRKTKFLRVFVETDGTKAGKRYHNGFLAQQVEEAAKDMGFDFAGVKYMAYNKDENGVPEGDDQYSLQYEQLIAPLVGAVQQLSKKVDVLVAENQELKNMVHKN